MKHLPLLAALFIAILFLISSVSAVQSPSPSPSTSIDALGCDGKCATRCSRSWKKDKCLRYCGICCGKCNGCVPSGPYVAKDQCPCYRDLKNPNGKDKCP